MHMSLPRCLSFILALSMTCSALNALGVESLTLSAELPTLDKRGGWRETLEDLTLLGVPQNWTLLGPLSNDTAKSFDRQLAPELSDDWNTQMTDNLGRLFKVTRWSKPKEDDGCYVDLYEIFSTPPQNPIAYAQTTINSPIDGNGILWFENAGRSIVYFNNRQILSVTGKISKVDASVRALYPIPVELKRGANVLKIKILKEKWHSQKGWGFFARIERDDVEWRKLLIAKLKEFYPEEDAGQLGAQERLLLARQQEKSGHPELAAPLYQDVIEKFGAFEDANDDARDALKRLDAKTPSPQPSDSASMWLTAEHQFKSALAAAQTIEADRILRDFIARYPFSEQAGLALCGRGALRLDYACEESARPFYERALREFSSNETVRTQGVKGLEFARFYMPEHAQLETNRPAEAALNALYRQLRNGNAHDNAAGLKAMAELLVAQSGAIVRTPGPEKYPHWTNINLLAHEFMSALSPDEQTLFREPLISPAELAYRQAMETGDALELEGVARKFPGAPASAKALNHAGNLYLDRGLYARAAQAFRFLLRDFRGSGLIREPLVAAKEIRALEGLGQVPAVRDALAKLSLESGSAKIVSSGREVSVAEFISESKKRLASTQPTNTLVLSDDYETFASNPRRLGAPAEIFAPVPDQVKWVNSVQPPSENSVRARALWGEDRTYAHVETFPVVSGDRLFFANRQNVRAFSLDSGKELWKNTWNDASYVDIDRFSDASKGKFCGFPQTLPVVKDDRLFVRIISTNKYSAIRCYDVETGSMKWDTEKIQALSKMVWSSEPLASYNLIIATYFEALDHETVRCGAAALDAKTGALVWNRIFGVGNSGIRMSERYRDSRYTQVNYRVTLQLGPPSAYEGIVYTSTGFGSLAALNASTGEIAWIAEYPRLRAGNLYTGNSGVEGFMPRMLKVLARGPSSPVVGESVVALAPRDAAGIVAFDRRTGAFRWAHELLDARYMAGVCDGNLIAADDTVTAINLETGKIAWEYASAGKRLVGQPGFSGGMLYLPCDDGLNCVDAHTGTWKSSQKWDPKTSGPLANVIVSGTRIIGVNNNSLVTIRSK